MAARPEKEHISKLDVNAIEEDVPEKRGIISEFVHDVKSLLGITSKKKGPNVKVDILEGQERDACIQEIPFGKGEKIVSDIYRVLEITKELAEDGELIAPVDMTPGSVPMKVFHIWMKTGNNWTKNKADFKEDGCIHGPLMKMDVFCVVAEEKSKSIAVGPRGYKYVSDEDNRVTVDFPPGAVEKEQQFDITLDMPNMDRYRAYKEYLPHMFDFVAGFSSTLKVDHKINQTLKKKATVTLPVDLHAKATDDWGVIFFSWQEETVEILGPGQDNDNNMYSMDVEHFSDLKAYRVRPSVPMKTVLESVKLLSGQLSLCTILTFIYFNYIETMPALVCDCVEVVNNQPEKRAAEYKQMGLHEIRLGRSDDIPMEDNCRIKVEIGGNLKLGPKVQPSVLNMHFRRYSATNRVVIPVKKVLGQASMSIVVYRGPMNRWEHPIHFPLSPDQCGRNHKPGQTRVPEYAGDVQKKRASLPDMSKSVHKAQPSRMSSKPTEVIPVMSQKSLTALSEVLTSLDDWRRVGIELDVNNEDITRIFVNAEKNHSLPALELLLYWQRNARADPYALVDKLASAFTELDRGDIAEKLYSAYAEGHRLTRNDFRI